MSLDDIDLSDPAFRAQGDDARDEAFARLRREAPIKHFDEPQLGAMPAGPGYWSITRYADVWQVSRHPELFQSSFIHGIKRMPCAFTPVG